MGDIKNPAIKLVDIQFMAGEKMRAGRNLVIALDKPAMHRLIKQSSEEEYTELEQIVEDMDCDKLRRWADRHSSKDLEDLSTADLRRLARKLNIKNSYREEYGVLLQKVKDAKDSRANRRNAGNDNKDDSDAGQSAGDETS